MNAVPNVENGVALETIGASHVATVSDSVITIPSDSGQSLTLDSGAHDPISVGLPGDTPGLAMDDSVVFPEVAADTTAVVKATEDGGAQVVVALDSADAPSTLSFPVSAPEGSSLQQNDDGSVTILGPPQDIEGGQQYAELGQIEAPWAVDATGAAVETTYSINGTTLVQSVQTDEATAYPVTADPKFSVGWGIYVRWSRGEALWLTGLGLTATAGAVAVLCVGPHAVLCGGAVAGIWYVLHSLTDWGINKLYNRGCYIQTKLGTRYGTKVVC